MIPVSKLYNLIIGTLSCNQYEYTFYSQTQPNPLQGTVRGNLKISQPTRFKVEKCPTVPVLQSNHPDKVMSSACFDRRDYTKTHRVNQSP